MITAASEAEDSNSQSISQNTTAWFRKAADQGNPDAQAILGYDYANGIGVTKDSVEASKWYRKAANQGNADAQVDLGNMYAKGDGVPKDAAEAAKWYRLAADQGEVYAQFDLGVMYAEGNGLAKNGTEAEKWFSKAANQGDAYAQVCLGSMYGLGEGIPKDFVEAYKWCNIAAASGNADAIKLRDGVLTPAMTPEQIAEAQRQSSSFVAHTETPETASQPNVTGILSGDLTYPKSLGTGFFVTDDGYFLTCFHVIQGAKQIKLKIGQGTLVATVIKVDSVNDVALLKVDGSFHSLPVVESRGVKLGDSLFTIGFPDPDLQGLSPKLSKGEISSLGGIQDDPREFQISVPVQPGNSGGPLVDQYGNVVGIIEAQLSDAVALEATGSLPQNVNYAMKSSILMLLFESVPDISSKLKAPNPPKNANFEESVKQVEPSVALVMVY